MEEGIGKVLEEDAFNIEKELEGWDLDLIEIDDEILGYKVKNIYETSSIHEKDIELTINLENGEKHIVINASGFKEYSYESWVGTNWVSIEAS